MSCLVGTIAYKLYFFNFAHCACNNKIIQYIVYHFININTSYFINYVRFVKLCYFPYIFIYYRIMYFNILLKLII